MGRRTSRTRRAGLAALTATGWVVAAGVVMAPHALGETAADPAARASAEVAAPAEQHCVVQVLGQQQTGELRTSKAECATTRTQAMREAGVDLASPAAVTSMIGAHYDGYAYTGSSFTVVGSDCAGGWLNLPAAWSNRVSSTMHGCPTIRHFDGFYRVTPEQTTTWPGANLFLLNDRTSSIQYLP